MIGLRRMEFFGCLWWKREIVKCKHVAVVLDKVLRSP